METLQPMPCMPNVCVGSGFSRVVVRQRCGTVPHIVFWYLLQPSVAAWSQVEGCKSLFCNCCRAPLALRPLPGSLRGSWELLLQQLMVAHGRAAATAAFLLTTLDTPLCISVRCRTTSLQQCVLMHSLCACLHVLAGCRPTVAFYY